MSKLYFQKLVKFYFFVAFSIGSTSPAYAYIDPGSSAYLIQSLLALVAAVIFYIRHPIIWIKNIFKKIFKKE